MKLIKIMPAALLLSLSLGVYAQDDDELVEGTEEDNVEVSIPKNPSDRPFFHRLQIGFMGTSAKYTNNSANRSVTVPASEKYFLKGVSFGWMGDLKLTKNSTPLYIELGGMLTYHTDRTKDIEVDQPAIVESVWSKYHYRIQAFSLTIPISLSYQFKDVFTEGLTLAPFAGVYGRFNLIANRWETKTTEVYRTDASGNKVVTSSEFTRTKKSLMEDNMNGHDGWMEGRTHTGKLLQAGAQVGVNAFYKHYSFGLAYMYDISPFAKHSSPLGITTKTTDQGGNLPSSGTGCDMEISTRHNFAITLGYIF